MSPALLQNRISTGLWSIGLLLLASAVFFFHCDAAGHAEEGRNEAKAIPLMLSSASAVLFSILLYASLFHYRGRKTTRIKWLNERAQTKADGPETDTSVQNALRPRFNGMTQSLLAVEHGVRTEVPSTLPHNFFSCPKNQIAYPVE